MNPAMRFLLLAILGVLVGIEIIWQHIGHFEVDVRSYGVSISLFFVLMLGSAYYEYFRRDRSVSSMLFGLAFLFVYAAILTIINYFGITIAGTRIDDVLAKVDCAMGVNWPELIVFAANHPNLNYVLRIAYQLSIWQPVLLIALLGWKNQSRSIEQFCLALVLGSALSVATWILAPSFGAITIYGIPASVAASVKLSIDLDYSNALLNLLANGPGLISIYNVKGLVGFPSFHTEMAIIITWYARHVRFFFYPVLIFNVVTIASTPIQGGHHIVDVVGGFVAAGLVIAITTSIAQRLTRPKSKCETAPTVVTAQ